MSYGQMMMSYYIPESLTYNKINEIRIVNNIIFVKFKWNTIIAIHLPDTTKF